MLDGQAAGVFATRTPHRPNPIGLSLVAIDSVDPAAGIVRFNGIDVIDGTPILDIKPFVPYEALGCENAAENVAVNGSISSATPLLPTAVGVALRYPEWLTAEGRKVAPLRAVGILPAAEAALRELLSQGRLQLYPKDGYNDIWSAIREAVGTQAICCCL